MRACLRDGEGASEEAATYKRAGGRVRAGDDDDDERDEYCARV